MAQDQPKRRARRRQDSLLTIAEGRDPVLEKQVIKADALRQAAEQARGQRDLYENVAREFIERHARKNNRTTTWQENARILGLRPSNEPGEYVVGGDVMPAWRGRKIQEIAKRDVIALLDSIVDRGAPIMANRTLRRTVASGMARLGIRLEVIERVLNHKSGSFRGVVGVYQRHSFSDEKRAALDAWAAHVEAVVAGKHAEPNVVSLRAAGA